MINEAPEELIELYTEGSCHLFAIACVRRDGGKFLVVENHDEVYWYGEGGEEDTYPVMHVYALHEQNGEWVARDILGDRPENSAASDAMEFFGDFIPYEIEVETEKELLRLFVKKDLDDDRPPLDPVVECDVTSALEGLDAVFPRQASTFSS